MRKGIVISSMGNMDIGAITLMGVTTKRDDPHTIGMFGTGIKYSISKMLRDGIGFRLWSGDHEVQITTVPGNFRGQAFDLVHVDGVPTSLTTAMGPQWETWWIVRELLSNARDEGVHEFFVIDDMDAHEFTPGWAAWVLDFEAFAQVWNDREKYFAVDRAPLWESENLRVLPRWKSEGTRVYKSGVLIYDSPDADAFDYDVLDADLNEMREPRYPFSLSIDATHHMLKKVDQRPLLRAWMRAQNATLRMGKECFTGSQGYTALTLSDTMKALIAEDGVRIVSPSDLSGRSDAEADAMVLSPDVARAVGVHIAATTPLIMSEPNAEQAEALGKALEALFAAGVKITSPVRVCELSAGQIGQALNGRILIAPRAFKNLPLLVATLLEEQLHINTGLSDRTIAFQNAIFSAWADAVLQDAPKEPGAPHHDSDWLQ